MPFHCTTGQTSDSDDASALVVATFLNSTRQWLPAGHRAVQWVYRACSRGGLICGVSSRIGCRRSKEKEAEHKWRENRLPELVVCKHAGN